MLRYRRYRVFLVFAVFAVATLYRFTSVRSWKDAAVQGGWGVQGFKHVPGSEGVPQEPAVLKIPNTSPTSSSSVKQTSSTAVKGATTTATTTANSEKEIGKTITDLTTSTTPAGTSSSATATTIPIPQLQRGKGLEFGMGGQGRHEVAPPLSDKPTIYWSRMPEHFPVPTESLMALPTGKAQSIPKIQFAFKDESPTAKIDREKKLKAVRDAFKHSWNGYREYAWLHDELKPKSGSFRDPFCTWAATLVDALDTLWIMGLEEEFAQATEALSQIDFTTSPRPEIPVFETTIRYLGGLLSANDLSGGKYKILREKAQELGDVLLSAFDTPNRMPITYYFWKPTFASNPHRAGTRTVLAELGSLSMEFTRLAQITGENKYYDAVARITNELELWQSNTVMPGLWPKYVDTSGCKKPPPTLPQQNLVQQSSSSQHTIGGPDEDPATYPVPKNGAMPAVAQKSRIEDWPGRTDTSQNTQARTVEKRQLDTEALMGDTTTSPPPVQKLPLEKVDCLPQGLDSPPSSFMEHFTFGGAADSTYEYLPKMHLLLGGQVPQYKSMYDKAIDAANKHLIFRPMIPDEKREILVVGSMDAREGWQESAENRTFVPEQTHLLCFAGGMWGMGSKIFGREGDMEIAEKLTDGCVWAYESTRSGIMPEGMNMIPCKSRQDCAWNETLWLDTLDPYWAEREQTRRSVEAARARLEMEQKQAAQELAANHDQAAAKSAENAVVPETREAIATTDATNVDSQAHADADSTTSPLKESSDKIPEEGPLAKRDLPEIKEIKETNASTPTIRQAEVPLQDDVYSGPPTETPNPYPTHEEYVKNRIKNERLPIGVSMIQSRSYILR
jgi:mannosyl-oligosaccharide alpha-1,2-mannosidase